MNTTTAKAPALLPGFPTAEALWAEARLILSEVMLACGDPNTIAQHNDLPRARHRQIAANIRFTEQMTRRIILLLASERAKTLPPNEDSPLRLAAPTATFSSPTHVGEVAAVQSTDDGGGPPPAITRSTPATRKHFDTYAPSSEWRGVCFHVITPVRAPRPNRNPTAQQRHRLHWKNRIRQMEAIGMRNNFVPRYEPRPDVLTASLARRAEAVRRAAANPEPVVERVARWLQRVRDKNRLANLQRRISAAAEPPRKQSYGWLCCGPLIMAATVPLNEALAYLNSG